MSLIPTWPIAAGALVVGVALGAGGAVVIKNAKIDRIEKAHGKEIAGWKEVQALATAKTHAAEVNYRQREQEIRENADRSVQEKQNEIVKIAAARDAAIVSLQSRPARPATRPGAVPAVAATCQGATGAQLFRDDGEFLIREAERADRQRADLAQCYAQYDAARALTNQPPSP